MARYVASDTHQLFVNGSLESLLPRCSVARSLWQGVCTLDFPGFDAKYNNDREGRPAIDPRRLAAVWILALMRGVTSSVQVARLCDMDIEFRWLSGDCGVEKSSLSAFRSNHVEELSDLSTRILASLARGGLLPAADLSVDGTVIRAAASCSRITSCQKLGRRLAHLGERIRERLLESDDDNSDSGSGRAALLKQQERLCLVRKKLPAVESLLAGVNSLTADAGYHDTLQLVELEGSIETCVSDDEQRNRRPPGVSDEYLSERFVYDAERDEMICPEGERLRRRKLNAGRTAMTYQGKKSVCDCCVAKSQCCPQSKLGRSVNRALYAELLEQVAERVASPSGQWYNRARKVTMEGAFARLTELLNWRRCRCWGTAGATAEGLWRTISHNLLLLIGHWKPLVHQGAPAG